MVSKKNKEQEQVVKANEELAQAHAELPEVKAEPVAVITPFDPKKLRSSGAGVWIYADDVKKINRNTFHTQRAKDFGIKENDVVHVVSNGKVETIGV